MLIVDGCFFLTPSRHDAKKGWGLKSGNVLFWSARTRPRLGTGRPVFQSESGDLSPHSKFGHGLSREDSVEMGSADRWPVVFGGPPNTSSNYFVPHQTIWRNLAGQSFRRAAENRTRAACAPQPTASFRLKSLGLCVLQCCLPTSSLVAKMFREPA